MSSAHGPEGCLQPGARGDRPGPVPPGDRLVETELAERFGVSRTPIREALQRLETQSVLARDGRSLVVSSLDHDQLGELYVVRAELEGLAARLAAQHAAPEEVRVLQGWSAATATSWAIPAGCRAPTAASTTRSISRATTAT